MEMNELERPREKVLRFGIETCSNRDLLALILRSGVKGKSVMELADEILARKKNLSMLQTLTIQELMEIKGIKKAKAIEILAVFELSKRLSLDELPEEISINKPETLVSWLNKEIGFTDQEHFMVIFLDTRNRMIYSKKLFVGSLDQSIVHPRDIFKEAIRLNSSKIMCVHNHPSGDVSASSADLLATRSIQEVGELVGIPLLDHLIVGKNNFLSMRSEGLLK